MTVGLCEEKLAPWSSGSETSSQPPAVFHGATLYSLDDLRRWPGRWTSISRAQPHGQPCSMLKPIAGPAPNPRP